MPRHAAFISFRLILLLVIVAAASFFVYTYFFRHLRHVRWGMSHNEVLSAEAPLVPLRDTPSTLVYATTAFDHPCLLTYAFQNGRLAAARFQFSLLVSDDVPPLTTARAHAFFLKFHSRLATRFGHPSSEKHAYRPRPSREDAQAYVDSLAAARERLDKRTDQLKKKYKKWPEAAARIDRELASEQRHVANLETLVAETEAAAHDTLPASDTVVWNRCWFLPSPHTVTLSADYTTTPARLEIRYKTNRSFSPASSTDL